LDRSERSVAESALRSIHHLKQDYRTHYNKGARDLFQD
jgi:hypothetical protein